MDKNIYDFLEYKLFLRELAKSGPGSHGFRSRVAAAAQCQRGYVTQVLNGSMHFSLEQAIRIAAMMTLGKEETEFFLLLVQYNRAGNEELRNHFRALIKEKINQRLVLKKRLRSPQALSFEDQSRYYSAWYYGAIRVALGVPELRSIKQLAKRFDLPQSTIKEVLEFLVRCGMIKQDGDFYVGEQHHMHIGQESSLKSRLHTNWRVKTLSTLQHEGPRDLHYSYVMTISNDDAVAVKSLLVNYIEELQKKVIPSKDETVCALCLDFFEL